jgi:hypothetical protein
LAKLKKGTVDYEEDFIQTASESFSPYYQPLIPWVNRLRKMVFPDGRRQKKENQELYSRMKAVLQEAREDPQVLEEI